MTSLALGAGDAETLERSGQVPDATREYEQAVRLLKDHIDELRSYLERFEGRLPQSLKKTLRAEQEECADQIADLHSCISALQPQAFS